MVKKDQFFIGSVLLNRPAFKRDDRLQLGGWTPLDRVSTVPAGAQILQAKFSGEKADSLGHVTATAYSPNLEQAIAMALVSGGRARMGERLFASSPINNSEVEVVVTSPVFLDPAGERFRV